MSLRALLVGINDYPDYPLRGCVNDALQLQALLIERYGLSDGQTRLLLDSQATSAAITAGLHWLAEADDDGTPAARLFFFAGHGTLKADEQGDEPDGTDECLLPYDHASAGLMTDDLLRQIYASFRAMPLLLIMDCCHAGTIHRGLDDDVRERFIPIEPDEEQRIAAARQRFQDRQHEQIVAQLRMIAGQPVVEEQIQQVAQEIRGLIEKQHFGQASADDNVVLLAACRADQTASDARFGETYHGVLSFYLLQLLRETSGDVSYAQLISQLRPRVQQSKFTQEPQLISSAAALDQPFLLPR